ncbi:MAG TPA: PEP/pyruvate-binding domain-containing protein [Acidimicrobiales bacterium]
MNEFVLPLEDCASAPLSLVGGKAAGLGQALAAGFDVPPGFVVTTRPFSGATATAGRELVPALDASGDDATLDHLVQLISAAKLDDLSEAVRAAYGRLGGEDVPVAVRSSSVSEDGEEVSFAGQYDTVLSVRGIEDVLRRVVDCWASTFRAHVQEYSDWLGTDAPGHMAVVVQQMVPAEAAGVMMTVDPVSGDRSQVLIEACHGLGCALVGGQVTPDRYAVDKVTSEFRSITIADKDRAAYVGMPDAEVAWVGVPASERTQPAISTEEALRLAYLGRDIERALGGPQDVEWAVTGPEQPRRIHVLQVRAETSWCRRPRTIAAGGQRLIERMVGQMVPRERPGGDRDDA